MPKIWKMALGVCKAHRIFDTTQDDIAQETIVRVFTHLHTLRDKERLLPWAGQIARHLCLDELHRRQHGAVQFDDSLIPPSHPNSLQNASGQHDAWQSICVQAVLDELHTLRHHEHSKPVIEVLRWCVANSPTTQELAQFLGTSEDAAKKRKSDILSRVKELCLKHCGSENCSSTP